MNVVQKNFRVTIVVGSALVLTIWFVFALSTERTEPTAPPPPLSISNDEVGSHSQAPVTQPIILQPEEDEKLRILPP